MVEDAIVSHHAHEDVEEAGVRVRNDTDDVPSQGSVPPGQHEGRNGQRLVEED